MLGKIRKNRAKNKDVYIIVILIFLIVFVLLNFYSFISPIDIKTFDLHVAVAENLGFNLDKDKIYFGKVPPGSSASRDIFLNHSDNSALRVKIEKTGNIAKWVSTNENDFILEPNTEKKISLTIQVPDGTEFGNYTGELKIAFRLR